MSASEPDPPRGATDTLPLRGATASDAGRESATEASWVGRVIAGRYAIERAIGRGGMGFVFEARHVAVGRRVAVKILRPEVARSAEAVARFHREARAAAAIGHPRIVEVLDFGHGDDGAYLVMELLQGADLASIVRSKGALPVERAVGIARQVADGLAAAHARGIVHRDLKSGNVFVTQRDGRDSVKVLDFGVSKALDLDDGAAPSTHQGTLVGTPHTMAPEQGTDGRSVDHRADLYALGCILFEMLTGELPFTGSTPVEVLYKHVHESPRRPSAVRGDMAIPRALDDLVLRLLAKDRDRRPADARAVIDALDRVDLARRGVRTRRVLAAVALVACAVGVALALGGRGAARATSRPRPRARVASPADAAVVTPSVVAVEAPDAEAPAAVLTVVVSPVGATVRVDGEAVPSPEGVAVLRATRGASKTVRAEAPGHAPREERVVIDGDTTLRWTLPALAREPREQRPAVRVSEPRVEDAGAPRPVSPDGLKASPYRRQ